MSLTTPERTTNLDVRTNELALLALIAVVTMLFAGFTAAYLVRRTGVDWGHVALPRLLRVSTAVLVLSSGVLEMARRRRSRRWLWSTIGLGAVFVLVQLLAWRELVGRGVFAKSHPHSSFFYMLTGVHGLHVLSGIGALAWALVRPAALGVCAGYWHFLGLLWIYLYCLLSLA